MDFNDEMSVSQEEYSHLQQRLSEVEKLNKKLARDLRISERNKEIIKVNAETQYSLTQNVSGEKQKQELYVQLLLRSHPDIIFVFDDKANFLLGTDSISAIIDVDDVSLLQGRSLFSIIDHYKPSAFTDDILAIIKNNFLNEDESLNNYNVEEKLEIDVTGSKFDVKILSFGNDYGVFAGFLVVMHDITELSKAIDNAEQASRSKSEFLSRMSHEMRTPMTAIIGMTTIAKKAQSEEKIADCLEEIEGASKHLLDVINNVLDMSKIEANKFEINSVPFNFKKMVYNAANVLSFRIEEKNQKLSIEIDDNIPQNIVSDEFRLTQVITNLLANAVKFTPGEGTITLRAVYCKDTSDRFLLRVEVEDNGIGVSPEEKDRLFDAFEQADGGTSRKYGGTGLGLAICRQIIEMMDGEIRVDSEPGKGSTFIFTIPLLTHAELQNDTEITGKSKLHDTDNEMSSALIPDGQFEGMHILIVDDVDINRDIISSILEDTGVKTDFADNGLKAVRMFNSNPFKYSMILMDIQMPEMDGYTATKLIRDSREGKNIPIIAMTANVFKEDIEACGAAGMDSHLGKPIDVDSLFKELKRFLIK